MLLLVHGALQADDRADLIFYNGQLITIEVEQPTAEAIAIADDKILAVGSDAEILALAGAETILVDLENRALMPGFVDAHTHIFNNSDFWNASKESVQQISIENGFTTVANMYSPPDFLAEIEQLAAEDKLRLRTSLYLNYTTNCGEVLGHWYRGMAPSRDPNLKLRILGIKIFTDGGSCGRPAIGFEYADTGGHGDLFLEAEFLNEAVQEVHDMGFQVGIHAQGDLAIEQALDAIELAVDGEPNIQRHRIDHNAYILDEQLSRYSGIGIVPVIFGAYFTCHGLNSGRYAEVFGEENLWWLEHWRRFVDANPGLIIAWHGDDPGVPPMSPILELYGFVTRNEVNFETGEVCEAPDWLKETTITVEEALKIMTMGSAYALFMEDAVGSLKPGKFADFVILTDSPLAVELEQIRDIEFLATYIGGNLEYCNSRDETFCYSLGADDINIALGKPVQASQALSENPPEMAVDGDINNWWGAGDHPPHWIEVDLGSPQDISRIKLVASQDPPGNTQHFISGRTSLDEPFRLLHQFNQFTRDLDELEFAPTSPWQEIRYIRVETLTSPSWVSWREIEVYSSR